jgi:hypothetical protein
MQKTKTILLCLKATKLVCLLLLIFRSTIINAQVKEPLKFPDTLVINEYIIVVESYDKGGVWDDRAKIFKNLNGIGWIKFPCGITGPEWPLLSKNSRLKPDRVTGSQAIPEKETTDNKNKRPYEGICVRFSDVVASVIKAGLSACKVLDGIAVYPTKPVIPAAPFSWNIHAGFTLEVSEVRFSPTKNALVTAQLRLPFSITQNEGCARGKLNLGSFPISPTCEFYVERPDSTFGVFGVGNTTLGIEGKGFVADFSSSTAYAPSGKPASWKGVVLMQGGSKGSPAGTVVSNIGYMQAEYVFTNAIVESTGLSASFQNTTPYYYGAAQPFGYTITFDNAVVNVAASQVTGGALDPAKIILPKTAVRQVNDAEIVLTKAFLAIRPNMDLLGYSSIQTDATIYWGDLIAAGGGNQKSFGLQQMSERVYLYFSAQNAPAFNPTNASGKKFANPPMIISGTVVEAYKMQGATFTDFGYLVVNTPNIPLPWKPNDPYNPPTSSPVWFRLNKKDTTWLNVVTEGVHCNIKGDILDSPPLKLGDPSKPLYVGVRPFETLTQVRSKQLYSRIVLQCVESAVITCDFRSHLTLPAPVGDTLSFKEMVFTSTANNAGGKLALEAGDSLAYWGLQLVPKPGFDNAGLVSVKTGQIILTAAGLAETRHFAQPFWLTWGEMLADGNMGRLYFDFNAAGQQFDKFNYIHNAVALSPFDPAPNKKGFLRVGGTAFFPFFGGDYLHIIDTYTPGSPGDPNNGRTVTLSDTAFVPGFFPTDSTIHGNWSNGLGVFDFTIRYAASIQDGFIGNGMSALRNLLGGDITSSLTMNSRGSCIRIGSNLMDQRSISIGPIANISNITRIWGCACIENDGIENLVVGGEVTNAANVSVAARAGSYLSAVLQLTPSLARITIDGEAYMSIAASLDALVIGHIQMTMNWAEGFMEGEVMGKFRVAEGGGAPPFVLSGSSLQAEGLLNWHLGIDFIELQGMVALTMMGGSYSPLTLSGVGAGTSVGAAFYIGKNAPKERAWVLLASNPKYRLNLTPMPARLTGIYGSLYVSQSVSLFIVSGGYELYLGLGAFVLEPAAAAALGALSPGIGLPYVVGNLGGRIHGEILGGLVSAAAWFNLQVLGPYPFGFQGTVGLEACVLWVACGSVDVTVGLNTTEGFYIR